MDKPTKPESQKPGEHEQGKFHYNPVNMGGKTEGDDHEREKPEGHEADRHRPEEKPERGK